MGTEMTWQPIETAPKDGRFILAWSDYDCTFIGIFNGTWWIDDHDNICRPTHWMPLPAPPEINAP